MIEWTQPKNFIPVHGSYHHLVRHASLARRAGVQRVEVIENGQTSLLDDGVLRQGARVRAGRVHVDSGQEIPQDALRERDALAETGVVAVTVSVDRTGALRGSVSISSRGALTERGTAAAEEQCRKAIGEALRELRGAVGGVALDAVREAARRVVRRYYGRGQARPIVLVHVQEG